MELMDRRCPGKTLLFVVDEVGQFVARDIQKMLDLQAVVQNLGRVGRGKMWIVVTSQEKLNELVGGLDDRRVELARLMDRFPLQVHLEPADISEVTSKRVLSKNAQAENTLRQLFTPEPWPTHRTHPTHSRYQASRANHGEFRRALPASAVPNRSHYPSGIGTSYPGRRYQARRRRQPDHHQACPAAIDPPGYRPRVRARWHTRPH